MPTSRIDCDQRAWLIITASLAVIYLLLRPDFILKDGDTYWQVATGQWIITHASLPTTDPFSYTMAGEPWVLFRQWLSQIALALVFNAAGWGGLVALSIGSAALAILILTRHLLFYVNGIQACISGLLALLFIREHIFARPHVLAWPLMVLWVAELVRAADQDRPPPRWLLFIMVAWANVHGSFVLGLGVVGVLAFEMQRARTSRATPLGALERQWIVFFILSVAAGFVTLESFAGIADIFRLHIQGVQLGGINEWQPPYFGGYQPLEVWLILFLLFSLGVGIQVPLMRLCLFIGLLHMALAHARYSELVGLLVPVLLAKSFALRLGPARVETVLFYGKPGPFWAAVLAGGSAVGSLVAVLSLANLAPDRQLSPRAAVEAIRAARICGRVLNENDFGGFLISEGIPTFVDGRSYLFGDDFLKTFFDVLNSPEHPRPEMLLAKHRISWTLLNPQRKLVAYLDGLNEWRRFYSDDIAVVHVRANVGTAPSTENEARDCLTSK